MAVLKNKGRDTHGKNISSQINTDRTCGIIASDTGNNGGMRGGDSEKRQRSRNGGTLRICLRFPVVVCRCIRRREKERRSRRGIDLLRRCRRTSVSRRRHGVRQRQLRSGALRTGGRRTRRPHFGQKKAACQSARKTPPPPQKINHTTGSACAVYSGAGAARCI